MSFMYNEADTRSKLIDEQLIKAGWTSAQRKTLEEVPLRQHILQDGPVQWGATTEYADYVLLGDDGKPLAVVEAKKTSRDAIAGLRQAEDYAVAIEEQFGSSPFILLTNGKDIQFIDPGRYPARMLAAFPSPDDLKRLAFQHRFAEQLNAVAPRSSIVDRSYQHEAIRRVTESLTAAQRRFLLVMATGTGKTRVAIALIDLLMRAKWIERVLFLVDRRELAKQAMGAFKEHMPNESRTRVEGGDIDSDARIHIATYPSMMQVYRRLSVGYYDLIVADESHRSIYNRYKDLFEYFDGFQLGLTATPTDYIEHNTFELFECPDGLPTFCYPYETAVDEKHLVPYKVHAAKTEFQLKGIKAGQLPPEMLRQLQEKGIDPSEIDFEGTDIEKQVTNTGTNDAMVQEFMEMCRRDANGTLPAKSIIFAVSQAHAKELWKSFNRLYPDLQRNGFAQLIHSAMERAEKMIDDFKYKDMPRVAISVAMLDTGIDVPPVQNLVFAKPVFSQVKFWQMIGRGTRTWSDPLTGKRKEDFLIIDHWDNFAYFNMNPEGDTGSSSVPLPARLFRARLEKTFLLTSAKGAAVRDATIRKMQTMLSLLPMDNVNVRPHLDLLNALARTEYWAALDTDRAREISTAIAPLLRYLAEINFNVMSFELKTEELALVFLKGEPTDTLKTRILEDIKRLPLELAEVSRHAETITWAQQDAFWAHLDLERIERVQDTLAPLMRFKHRRERRIIALNLPDQIVSRQQMIIFGPAGEGAFVTTYRDQVIAFIRDLADEVPAMRKLQHGGELTAPEVEEIAAALNQADLFITEERLQQAFNAPDADLMAFLRHILKQDPLASREDAVRAAFDQYVAAHPRYTASQIAFLRTVREAVINGMALREADLEGTPFSRIGNVHILFSDSEIHEILDMAVRLAS